MSLSHLSAIQVPPPQLVELAASSGFDAVSIRVARTAHDRGFQLSEGSDMLRDTKSSLADNGLRVLDVEVVKLHPGSSREDWLFVCEAGAELGAEHLVVTVLDDDPARATDNLAALSALTAEYDLRVCLEPMIFSSVRDLAAAAALVAAPGMGSAGVLVDSLHFARAGSELHEIAAVDERLLPYCQICDSASAGPTDDHNAAITEARTDRLAPGEGVLPLVELLRALPPAAVVAVEAPSPRSITDPGAWIAALGSSTRALLDKVGS